MHRLLLISILLLSMVGCTQEAKENASTPEEAPTSEPAWTPNAPTPIDEDD